MATATKKSPDYDPIEEALDIGYRGGKEEERKRREQHVQRARRGGQRTGSGAANRQAEEDRKRRAKKTREANTRVRANRAARQEEDKASARRGSYRAGQADARRRADEEKAAQRDAARQAKAVTSSGSPSSGGFNQTTRLNAPNLTPPGAGIGDVQYDRTTSARFIVIATVIGTVLVVARDATTKAPTKTTIKVGNETVQVPQHLRSLAAVFIMGTVSLIVNELNPALGMLFGVGLLLDTGLATLAPGTKGGLGDKLATNLFGGGAQGLTPVPGTPSSSPKSGLPAPGGAVGASGGAAGGGGGGGGGSSW